MLLSDIGTRWTGGEETLSNDTKRNGASSNAHHVKAGAYQRNHQADGPKT